MFFVTANTTVQTVSFLIFYVMVRIFMRIIEFSHLRKGLDAVRRHGLHGCARAAGFRSMRVQHLRKQAGLRLAGDRR